MSDLSQNLWRYVLFWADSYKYSRHLKGPSLATKLTQEAACDLRHPLQTVIHNSQVSIIIETVWEAQGSSR